MDQLLYCQCSETVNYEGPSFQGHIRRHINPRAGSHEFQILSIRVHKCVKKVRVSSLCTSHPIKSNRLAI